MVYHYFALQTDGSRRGDLEILGYCMIEWINGHLPWSDDLVNKDSVAKQKNKFVNSKM